MNDTPLNVDEYLESVPEEKRTALELLRQNIKTIATEAEEVISYKIPTFKLLGSLVAFSAAKDHCSFHIMSPNLMKQLENELKDFNTTTSTIHFSKEKPIPEQIVRKIVLARIEENKKRKMKY